MSKAVVIIGGILAFLTLCFLCASYHGPEIERALASTKDEAGLRVAVANGKVEIRGTLPDNAAKETILTRARHVYADATIVDNIVVDSRVQTIAWMPSILGLFDALKDVKEAGFTVGKGLLTVSGIVRNADAGKSLVAEFDALNTGLSLVDLVEVEAASVQKRIDQFLEGKTIEFGMSSTEISPSGKATLDTVVLLLMDAPEASIEVGGHTDNQGNDKANMALSQGRADATKAYLAEKGITREKITAVGYGEIQPIATNFTPEGRQRNRRIVFTLK
jgi:OOP family OmpA-OmpF porin